MNAADLVTTTIAGRTFTCTRRTEAHMLWTVERLAVDYPSARLVIIQPCYNTGVAASAGTHDLDAVFDVQIVGLPWTAAQDWLRVHGWAAWYRYPPTFSAHIHMVSLGYPGPVGIYVPGQVRDYYAARNGLAGHATDSTWRPTDIDASVFDYDAWLERNEMNPAQDERLKTIEENTKTLVAAIAEERKRDRQSWRREAALAKEVKRLGGDVDQVLAAVVDD